MTANSPNEPSGAHGPQSSEEERLRTLESQVQALAEAVRALARSMEQPPPEDAPLEEEAPRGARLAHEILLAQGL